MLSLRRIEPGHVLGALVVALSGLAWIIMWVLERAPAANAFHHHGPAIVRDDPRLFPLFVAGWTVMVVAMMLPTQLPLLVTLQHHTRCRYPILFGGLLIAGYLAAWALYGVAVYAAGWLLHQAVTALPWLQRQAWTFGALSLIVAGSYQLTPAKRSLLQSHHPAGDNSARQGQARVAAPSAVLLGVRHGLGCIGCCWSLMLLMFGAGAGSFGWMLALGTIMTLEKTPIWGRRLVAPLGVSLIVSGVLVLFLAAPVSGHAGVMPR